MAIPLTGTGGLFTRLGRIGAILKSLNSVGALSLPTLYQNVEQQYIGSSVTNPEPDLIAPLQGQLTSVQTGLLGGLPGTLTTLAQQTVIRMVHEDNPQADSTLATAVKELIRQMNVANATVERCAVSLTPQPYTTSNGPPVGNGVLVGSVSNGLSLFQENTFQENAFLTCSVDAQTGGATAGNETFQFAGLPAEASPLQWDWPLGSGATLTFQAVNASANNTQGTLLNNGDFETFTTPNVPNNWVIAAGTAGTQVLKGSALNSYTGAGCLQLAGDGLTNTTLTQAFSAAAGTLAKLAPETVYALNFWLKVDAVPAAGVLAVEVINGFSQVLMDDQNVPAAFSTALTGAGTTYAAINGVVRTPRVLPANAYLRLRLSTPLSNAKNAFIDRLGMTVLNRLYPGGPYLSAFSGSVPWILGDAYQLVITNARGGQAFAATFQSLTDRLLNMKQLGLVLPSSATPTISDTLIV